MANEANRVYIPGFGSFIPPSNGGFTPIPTAPTYTPASSPGASPGGGGQGGGSVVPAGMVPVRSYLEGMGAKVNWDQSSNSITAGLGRGAVSLKPGTYQEFQTSPGVYQSYASPETLADIATQLRTSDNKAQFDSRMEDILYRMQTASRPSYTPPPERRITMDEANSRATAALKPIYDRNLRDALTRSLSRQDARGIATSPLGEQVDLELEGDMGADYMGQVGNMANSMYNQSESAALESERNAISRYNADLSKYQALLQQLSSEGKMVSDTAGMNRDFSNDTFNQAVKMKELGNETMKVMLMEKNQEFIQWLEQQKLDVEYQKMDFATKSKIADLYMEQRGQDITAEGNRLSAATSASNNAANNATALEVAKMGKSSPENTAVWKSYIDQAINSGDIKSIGDAMAVILKNTTAIKNDKVDAVDLIQYVTQVLTAKAGKNASTPTTITRSPDTLSVGPYKLPVGGGR